MVGMAGNVLFFARKAFSNAAALTMGSMAGIFMFETMKQMIVFDTEPGSFTRLCTWMAALATGSLVSAYTMGKVRDGFEMKWHARELQMELMATRQALQNMQNATPPQQQPQP